MVLPSLIVNAPFVVDGLIVIVFAAEPSYVTNAVDSLFTLIPNELGFFNEVGTVGYTGKLITPAVVGLYEVDPILT